MRLSIFAWAAPQHGAGVESIGGSAFELKATMESVGKFYTSFLR
jgi:hypothetical protein